MKQYFKHNLKQIKLQLILIVIPLFIACSGSDNYHFNTADEAIKCCIKEYNNMQDLKNPSITDISTFLNKWRTIEDSTYAIFLQDSSAVSNTSQIKQFISISDSVRSKLFTLMKNGKYTMNDLLTLKLKTSHNRSNIKKSEEYEKVKKFYAALDKEPLYPDYETTLTHYRSLISDSSSLKKEQDLIRYLKAEDICFRSYMKYLDQSNINDLTEIAEKTNGVFDKIYLASMYEENNPLNKRLLAYLSLRLLRRSILNAEVCLNKLIKGETIPPEWNETYRWMILNPFIELDDYIMAYITSEQKKQMEDICSKLHIAMAILDGKNINEIDDDKARKNLDILVSYFIASYIRSIL